MNYNPCCASKDYLRAAYCIIEDLIYAEARVKTNDCVSENFVALMVSQHRAAIALSENLLEYSAFEPIRDIARMIVTTHNDRIKRMRMALRRCKGGNSPKDEWEEYMAHTERICGRMTEEMRCADIGERINCDYIRHMIPLLEGGVRMAENALGYGICNALVPYARDIVESHKRMISALQKLICMICG